MKRPRPTYTVWSFRPITQIGTAVLLAFLSFGCAVKHETIKTPMVCTCVLGGAERTAATDDPADCAVHGPAIAIEEGSAQ